MQLQEIKLASDAYVTNVMFCVFLVGKEKKNLKNKRKGRGKVGGAAGSLRAPSPAISDHSTTSLSSASGLVTTDHNNRADTETTNTEKPSVTGEPSATGQPGSQHGLPEVAMETEKGEKGAEGLPVQGDGLGSGGLQSGDLAEIEKLLERRKAELLQQQQGQWLQWKAVLR